MNKLAIIVPTINRPTLTRAINSIGSQTSQNCKAYVVGDNVMPNFVTDSQLDLISISADKQGDPGLTRNQAIKYLEPNTEWIGFLDDDDVLESQYVSHWEAEKDSCDLLVFRMMNRNHVNGSRYVVSQSPVLQYGNIGINFCVKLELFNRLGQFKSMKEAGTNEDWEFLSRVKESGAVVKFSPYLGYTVRPE